MTVTSTRNQAVAVAGLGLQAMGSQTMPLMSPCCVHATHLLLGDLERALVPANLQQLHDTLLIGREAGHLAHELPDELGALAQPLQTQACMRQA